jgi:hypothetical protein
MNTDPVIHKIGQIGPTGRGESLSGRPLTLDRDRLELWLMFRPESLRESIEFFALGGARDSLPESIRIEPFNRVNGYSGYVYRVSGDTYGEIGFAPLRWGGFVTHKILCDPTGRQEIWEVYSAEGKLTSVDRSLFLDLLYVDMTEMDPRCPLLSHLYCYLSYEYAQAQVGQSRTAQIALIEGILRGMRTPPLWNDPAVTQIWKKMTSGERDLVLGWEERQRVIESLLEDRAKIVAAKARVHRRSRIPVALHLKLGDWVNRAQRFRMRPGSNLRGFAYKYTIGLMLWFIHTVRSNIGYSIALALYGPFTFYFITQPLNPHAMWAVGRVRTAYLDTTEKTTAAIGALAGGLAGSAAVVDSALPAQSGSTAVASTSAPSAPPAQAGAPGAAAPPAEAYGKHLGMPLSPDFKSVDQQSWSDRMSSFKNMQIGYESNLEFAARMGRLEQMELQLNFSMIVDSTWEETQRYLDQLASLKASLKNPSPELVKFINEEEIRTRRAELYIWDKLLRYILDHPYVVLDQSKEQVYRDYYMGRSILLLRDMTAKLAAREKDFTKPADFKRLEAVAAAFQKTRVEGATVMERLRKNSKLFNQADHTDGTQLRAYMKRQWEILYLLQNKAQEASNFGLQMYTWSVRNSIWLLQSLYSAKRRELQLLFESPGKPKGEIAREIDTQIEPLYEQLVHMMSLEFASIRPEISQRLSDDIDARQRKVLIDGIEAFIHDREKVLKGMIKR